MPKRKCFDRIARQPSNMVKVREKQVFGSSAITRSDMNWTLLIASDCVLYSVELV